MMKLAKQFEEYAGMLAEALGHADRVGPFKDYCTGLMLAGERKSVEPMAARVSPTRVSSAHQSLHHFVAEADWSDAVLSSRVREWVLPRMSRQEPIEAWIVDDTGYPKKGTHSVGVARQYCGQLGKQDNCQVAVTLSVANERASLPIAYRLYLPKDWAADAKRRAKAGVPQEVRFATKGAIALSQIEQALADGVAQGVVLADAGYGTDSKFRARLTELGLAYAVGIVSTTSVWPEGKEPLAPKPWAGRGRRTKLLRRDAKHKPVSLEALAASLAQQQWRQVTWRAGADGELCSRFARVRVRPAHHDYWRAQPWPEQWLLIEWPSGAPEPIKYWLSTLGDNISLTELVRIAKLRWRIERDYQELKQELGLGHFEGRGWRGFHHHATLCIAAYGFLVAQRAQAEARSKKNRSVWIKAPALPANFRPRGSPEPRPAP
jgi:SRSO17 transposase